MFKKNSWFKFRSKRSGHSFFGTALKSLFVFGTVFLLSYAGLETWSYTANLSQKIESLKQVNETVTGELSTMRSFLLNSCQEENDVRSYLFLPEKNCGKYFPDLIVRETGRKSLEEEFLAAFHELILEQNKPLLDQLSAADTEPAQKNDTDESTEASDNDNAESQPALTIMEIPALTTNDAIISYLAEYEYQLEPFGESGIHLKQNGSPIADLYWDQDSNTPMLNLLEAETILSLDRLSGRIYEWKHQQNSDVRSDLLAKIRDTEGDTTPRRNILLLGKNGGNVDTIILASIDHIQESITLISVPRDLWYESRKINSLYAFFGIEYMVKSLSEILGQEIHNYVMIDMLAFPDVIDAIGGIDYTFEQPLIDPSYHTIDDGEEGTLFFARGTQHLNGIQALRVARSRNTTSDFHRAARQQQILHTIKAKLARNGKIDSILAITPVLYRHVKTDFESTEAVQLFWKSKSYEVKFGNIMSTKNILNSTMLPLGNGLRTYVLLPKENDWDLIKKFVWSSLLEQKNE